MKYMITGIGEAEIILVGNSKSKLMKEVTEIAKATYESYLENCKYLNEKPVIKYNDFKFCEIEEYNEYFIDNNLSSFELREVQ